MLTKLRKKVSEIIYPPHAKNSLAFLARDHLRETGEQIIGELKREREVTQGVVHHLQNKVAKLENTIDDIVGLVRAPVFGPVATLTYVQNKLQSAGYSVTHIGGEKVSDLMQAEAAERVADALGREASGLQPDMPPVDVRNNKGNILVNLKDKGEASDAEIEPSFS